MFGLAYLAAAFTYFVVMGVVVRLGWRMGRATSVQRALSGAVAGFLIVFLPLFWNWIPTALHYRRLCATDAGFVAYSGAAKWAADHKTLVRSEPLPALSRGVVAEGFTRRIDLDGLRAWDRAEDMHRIWAFAFRRSEQRIVDLKANKVLAHAIDYEAGDREDLRFWMVHQSCFTRDADPIAKLVKFAMEMKEGLE